MDYKEKYEGMVQRARELHEAGNFLTKKQMEIVCPELTEGEDEKVRKAIIELLKEIEQDETYKGRENIRYMLAYLEKQKDINCLACDQHLKGYIAGRKVTEEERQKERGPLTKEEENTLQNIILHLEDEGCPTEWKSLLHDIYNLPYTEEGKRKEQKPLTTGEWEMNSVAFLTEMGYTCIPPIKDGVIEKKIDALMEEQKPMVSYSVNLTELIAGGYEEFRSILKDKGLDYEPEPAYWESTVQLIIAYVKQYLKEQKPAEWSEEDEITFKCIKSILKDYMSENYKGSKYCTNEQVKKWIKWFDTVFHSLSPQPKVEWSEKDERILKGIIGLIDHDQHYGVSNKEMLAWLKSLRPSWKPSEEELVTLKCVGGLLRESGFLKEAKTIFILEGRLANLSTCAWKPSEEQMSMLLAVIRDPNNAGAESCHLALDSLYNDLKKL